jgi:acetyl esterase/lipase
LEKETIQETDVYTFKGEGYPSGKHIFYLHGGAYVARPLPEQQGIDINYYEYPNMIHVFPVIPVPLPEVEQAKKQMVDIINGI